MRHPTWGDIRRFCQVDGWEPTHHGRGRKRRDHDRYTKTLPDGSVLRTKASHGNDEIGDPALVSHILRDQLRVSHEEFWNAVDHGIPPDRSGETESPAHAEPAHQLPDWLAVNLAVLVGLSDEEIGRLNERDAMEMWVRWCSEQQ